MASFDDEIRAGKAEIRAVMFNDAVLERTVNSSVDRVTGKAASKSTKKVDCKARLGVKDIRNQEGTVVGTRMEAKVDAEPVLGDVLNYEGAKWRVTEILESAPDGIADQWTVVVQK